MTDTKRLQCNYIVHDYNSLSFLIALRWPFPSPRQITQTTSSYPLRQLFSYVCVVIVMRRPKHTRHLLPRHASNPAGVQSRNTLDGTGLSHQRGVKLCGHSGDDRSIVPCKLGRRHRD